VGTQGAAGTQGPQGSAGTAGTQGPQGSAGTAGTQGPQGSAGTQGPQGSAGTAGTQGPQGSAGTQGPQGSAGTQGTQGPQGFQGSAGTQGTQGPQGFQGNSGVSAFADFYALMPGDNAATVAPGTDVEFPQNGPTSGSIARTGASTFNLPSIGTYQVLFQVSVDQAGQLILTLNGADLAYTVVGRATGTSQIVGICLVQTSVVNSVLTVRNPAGNSTALTITPIAGGTRPVSAHLTILFLA